MKIVALAGGVGASKLLFGLARVMPPGDLTIVVNTGDDIEMHGLTICPDLDIVTYTLAGVVNPVAGWGIDGDTFAARDYLGRYGRETWFNLGDRDLATHIHRTDMLHRGATLSACAESIRRALGVEANILPMSDEPVRTQIETESGLLPFQHYLVKHRAVPKVAKIHFHGAASAEPAPGVMEAIAGADGIVICPSNPLISIGPILAVPGIRKALASRRANVAAISPIVGGASLKGPSDKMMAELSLDVSALGVAQMYRDISQRIVIDTSDAELRAPIEQLGMSVSVSGTVMRTDEDKVRLAACTLSQFEEKANRAPA
ncbi:MAG: 2-phospho-L-lactate transferase [Candidatus Acidiferrales bacterium]|jgi:LPPG:FO 2-phospho-L-lactate transferase